ncbi:hypothetical protein [Hymenobacter glacieicola]|uniref:Uncharacterized protein n=1 Tax=Hymenobacter glacieicola TaxID=1562124 RepID=A0ABQ1WJ12_9BACT|nr:hypothetical protein [Hymenobacter glacieicola]GGG32567.1 hypothetical protein GCM10011378_06210 [Hymenobacter glacieicola]
MNNLVTSALAEVYRQFSRYRLHQLPDACPCCITLAENTILWMVPLPELSEQQLRRYAFKAMTTWGNTNDFRYFLPRLLELVIQPESEIDKEVFFGKIIQAGWAAWPTADREAVRIFIRAWWSHHIQHECFFENELLAGLIALLGSLDPLLATWKISFANWSFENLINLVEYVEVAQSALQRIVPDEALATTSGKQLNLWLIAQLSILEQGFFHYASVNPDFAQRVSRAYTIVAALPA